MKPLPTPSVPGKTDAERMSNALRIALSVSKEELLAREARWKAANARKRSKAKASKKKPA